jgi:hypothetical protein
MKRMNLALFVGMAVSAVLSTAGCGKKCDCIPAEGSPDVALGKQSTPTVMASSPNPCEIDVDFGSMPVGQTATAVINVDNVGAGILELTFGSPSLPSSLVLSEDTLEPLEPGTFFPFGIVFTPSAVGVVSTTLTVKTDGMNLRCPADPKSDGVDVTVVVAGTGVGAK